MLLIPVGIALNRPIPKFIGNGYVEITNDRGRIGGGTIIRTWSEINPTTNEKEEHSYVLTANHVVAGAKGILVNCKWFDANGKVIGNEYLPATVVDSNEELDYAILKAVHKAREMPTKIAKRNSYVPRITDRCIAVGSPLGNFWVTDGIISAIPTKEYEGYVGHSANVYFGNSGGPLYNEEGEQIGVIIRFMSRRFPEAIRKQLEDPTTPMHPLHHMGTAILLDRIFIDLGREKTQLYFGEETW